MKRILLAGAAVLGMAAGSWAHGEVVKADTPVDIGLVGGFVAVHDWDRTDAPDMLRLTAPEHDLVVSVIDVPHAADARAAAAAALTRAGAAPYPVETVTARAPINGWDERALLTFTLPPALHLDREVLALRKGDHWTVLVLDGSAATEEKRAGALGTMFDSLRAKGYHDEDFAKVAAYELTPERIAALKDFLTDAMAKLKVPGVGFALIQHGKIVWEGGLGVKAPGSHDPIDAHTRFMIASNTKGMSTLMLSMLADRGKVKWDEPVTQVYPTFRLGSEATTKSVVMRQLVCACTGLPRKDLEWLFNGEHRPASDTFAQLSLTEPTSKFGEVFQYNNLMAAAAGYIGGHIAFPDLELGAAYDRAMQTLVFDPLGMKDTTFSMDTSLATNHADPSALDLDGTPIIPPQTLNRQINTYRPAGGAWSSAHDVAQYVLLELGAGQMPDGRRLVSEANILARRAHNVPVSQDSWYGMGLETRHRYGIDMVYHGGSMLGYQTNWFALPQSGVGAVVLTNSEEGVRLLDPFLRRLVEVLYDGRPEAAARIAAIPADVAAQLAATKAKLTFGPAAFSKLGLAAHYRNADLGDLTIAGANLVKAGPYTDTAAVQHNADGTDSIVFTGPDLTGTDLLVGKSGAARTLTLRDGQHVYLYTEQP